MMSRRLGGSRDDLSIPLANTALSPDDYSVMIVRANPEIEWYIRPSQMIFTSCPASCHFVAKLRACCRLDTVVEVASGELASQSAT